MFEGRALEGAQEGRVVMQGKTFGAISFALAVSPALAAQAAPATPAIAPAKSYAELLEPIPNATERLKIADLELIRSRLRAVSEAGCDDLLACVHLPSCPIPFEPLAEPQAGDAPSSSR